MYKKKLFNVKNLTLHFLVILLLTIIIFLIILSSEHYALINIYSNIVFYDTLILF